jgi:hypothetical protein
MNYLAHAYLANLEKSEPAFALGAMLPDLANLVGVRVRLDSGPLVSGVQFHHRSDDVFHSSQQFQSEQLSLIRIFTARGLRRGPARALAHLGLEFLFDAGLADDAAGYLVAIAEGARRSDLWTGLGASDAHQLQSLCGYLERRGLEGFEATEARFTTRLGRTLEGRPRLAPTATELGSAVDELLTRAPAWRSMAKDFAHALHLQLQVENWQAEQNHPS